MQSLYGSQAYPVPPSDRNLALVSDGILQTTSGLVMGVMFDVVDRSAVQQGPLLKVGGASLFMASFLPPPPPPPS